MAELALRKRGRPRNEEKKPMLLSMAEKYGVDERQLFTIVKRTLIPPKKVRGQGGAPDTYKEASDEEILGFLAVAHKYGLDPFTKEIGAFVARNGAIVPFVMIDGWINVVNNQPRYAGFTQQEHLDDRKNLYATTTTIRVKDPELPGGFREVQKTEWLHECKRDSEPWKMEHRMLGHKSFMQCARYAFGLSGLYDQDEALDIVTRIESEAEPTLDKPPVALSVAEVAGTGVAPPLPEKPPEKAPPPPASPESKVTGTSPPATPAPSQPEHKTDEDKRKFVGEVSSKYADYCGITNAQALFQLSKFEKPDSPGEWIGLEKLDDPRLKGRWLNKIYGKCKEIHAELAKKPAPETEEGVDPDALPE